MKALVVDDEQPARRKIISFLKDKNEIEKIIEAGNGVDAIEKIYSEKPDIIFLDIQMPGLNGFEVIKEIGVQNMPPIVFVTAYDQYAINAFEVNAVDYLLKPYDKERFLNSFARVKEKIELKLKTNNDIKLLLEEVSKGKKILERFLVSVGPKYFFVAARDIIFISSAEKYVELHTSKGKYLVRETMNNIESSLDPGKFARIHRSYMVNVEQIQEMQPWSHGDYIVILKNGERLNMSRRYKDHLFS